MESLDQIMIELESYGSENTKKIWRNHGIKEPCFGVKVGDLKKIQKRIKTNYDISLALFDTQNADAMYLAALIAEDKKMTKDDLNHWVEMAVSSNIRDYAVPWVCAGSNFGFELALAWIENKKEHIAVSGWQTLTGLVSLVSDDNLDLKLIEQLLHSVQNNILTVNDRQKYAMNSFVISVGVYVKPLTNRALEIAKSIGKIEIDFGKTACKLPNATEYINKSIAKGQHGKKKKTVKC